MKNHLKLVLCLTAGLCLEAHSQISSMYVDETSKIQQVPLLLPMCTYQLRQRAAALMR